MLGKAHCRRRPRLRGRRRARRHRSRNRFQRLRIASSLHDRNRRRQRRSARERNTSRLINDPYFTFFSRARRTLVSTAATSTRIRTTPLSDVGRPTTRIRRTITRTFWLTMPADASSLRATACLRRLART